MQRKILTILAALAVSISAHANFKEVIRDVQENWIEPAFPIIAGIIFLVGVLLNMGKFMGEDRDIKKGISNIVIFLVVILSIGGVYSVIKNMTL